MTFNNIIFLEPEFAAVTEKNADEVRRLISNIITSERLDMI